MKITEQILALYKTGELVDRDLVTRDLDTTQGGASRALAYLHNLGALTQVSEERPLRYRVIETAESIYHAMIEERKCGESIYLEKLNIQKAKKRGLPTLKWVKHATSNFALMGKLPTEWVKHATSNFALMGKLPTEPYDSLVRAVRGPIANNADEALKAWDKREMNNAH